MLRRSASDAALARTRSPSMNRTRPRATAVAASRLTADENQPGGGGWRRFAAHQWVDDDCRQDDQRHRAEGRCGGPRAKKENCTEWDEEGPDEGAGAGRQSSGKDHAHEDDAQSDHDHRRDEQVESPGPAGTWPAPTRKATIWTTATSAMAEVRQRHVRHRVDDRHRHEGQDRRDRRPLSDAEVRLVVGVRPDVEDAIENHGRIEACA